jgi:hypothetical protein
MALQPNTRYVWRIVDHFQNIYTAESVSDDAGMLEIPFTIMPDGFSAVGVYTLTLHNSEGAIVLMSNDDIDYDRIRFAFVSYTGEGSGNVISFAAVDTGDEATPDLACLTIDIVTAGQRTILLDIRKLSDDNVSRIDWGDGHVDDFEADDHFTAEHTYVQGSYTLKFYPVAGLTNPQAHALTQLSTIELLYAAPAGPIYATFGPGLEYCTNLQNVAAIGFCGAKFPKLPDGSYNGSSFDQVRQVNLPYNQLGGFYVSRILRQLDNIDWHVGYLDLTGNPGINELSTDGQTALDSLTEKGWTINI